MERVKTGIKGLDEMLNGGIPKRHHVLVAGGPGTGKTTFGMQYLYEGAKNGEKGVYITLEEKPEKILENIKANMDWDVQKYIDKKDIVIALVLKYDFKSFNDMLQSFIVNQNVKRVVVDSITLMELFFEKELEFRRNIYNLLDFLSNLDCTVVLTGEKPYVGQKEMKRGLEEFVVDGVFILYNFERENRRLRGLEILKMRGTKHRQNIVPLSITNKGIVVYPEEKLL